MKKQETKKLNALEQLEERKTSSMQRFNIRHIIGRLFGVGVLVMDMVYLKGTAFFVPMIIIALTIAWSQFWLDFFIRKQKEKEMEGKFSEFVRNLVGAVKSGMPFATAIIHASKVDYGSLDPYVKKLAHKMEWSVPIHKAFQSFANETGSKVIKRAITTVIEAEQSGGNIEDVLESITESLIDIKKMKEKRRASIHGQIVQSYTIFFAFLAIMIMVQNMMIPYLMSVQQTGAETLGAEEQTTQVFSSMMERVHVDYSSPGDFIDSSIMWFKSFNGIFLMLSLIQALFAGLVIGKLAEGDTTSGLKHSIVLMTIAFVVISLSQGFLK